MMVAEKDLEQRVAELVAENRRLAAEKAAVEQRLGRAAQVSAAVQQLHEADDVEDRQDDRRVQAEDGADGRPAGEQAHDGATDDAAPEGAGDASWRMSAARSA